MKTPYIFKYIFLDDYSVTPKYLQIVNCILRAIESNKIQKEDILPSINETSNELEISRDTIEKAYRHLKKLGIINAIRGKGYFISATSFQQRFKVFLLFNKLSDYKKLIYDAFAGILGENSIIDFYVYNNDFNLFKKILLNVKREYTHYVIIPQFSEGGERACDIINSLSEENVILLERKLDGIKFEHGAVVENFERDIYWALEQSNPLISKYKSIKLLFPENSYYPKEIKTGFIKFCKDYAFDGKTVSDIASEDISEGDLFINIMESDLAVLVEKLISLNLNPGKEVGIISYNETPLKRVILNGITTISTDFRKMGELAAGLILENSMKHIEVPFNIHLRPSL